MRLHQVIGFSLDSVAAEAAFALDEILSGIVDCAIYSDQLLTDDRVRPLGDLTDVVGGTGEDVIVFHTTVVDHATNRVVRGRPERLVVIHHGAPEADPYIPFSAEVAGLALATSFELKLLSERAEVGIATSQGALQQLQQSGFDNVVEVAPIGVRASLSSIDPNGPTLNHFATSVTKPVIIVPETLLPGRRLELVLEAYNVLITHLRPETSLIIVGDSPLDDYRSYLDDVIKSLNLHKAGIFGRVTQQELAAIYSSADVVLSLGEDHLAQTLTDAAGFGLPVITNALIDRDADALLVAEIIHEVLGNDSLRRSLVASTATEVGSYADVVEHVLQAAYS